MEIKETCMIGLLSGVVGKEAADHYVTRRDSHMAVCGELIPRHISDALNFAIDKWVEVREIIDIEDDRVFKMVSNIPWWFCKRAISFQDLVHYMDVIWGPEQIHVVSLQLHGMSVHRIIGYGNKVVGGWSETRVDAYGSQYSCFIVDRNQKVL